jgi:UMF1 family MFS transporter
MLLAGIVLYVLIVAYAFRMSTATDFWILAGVVGLIMGGMQAVSRSFFSRLIPEGMNAEYFGFFSVSQRFASIFGPLLFALVSDITGSPRLSILSLALLFLSGGALLLSVRDSGGK